MTLAGIVKLRLPAGFDAQHGGFATGWGPVSWGSIDELFVNLTMPLRRLRDRLRRREIAKLDYFDRVVEVRRRYPLLSLRVWQWVEG